jgi:hypothetical protein
MSIPIHRIYYGPVEGNGILLKTSPEVKDGKVINDDMQTDIYTKKGKFNLAVDDSELLYTAHGPVIRVTRIKPLQSQDKRTTQSCNITLLVQLSDISKLLLPLLDLEPTFPLTTLTLETKLHP